MIIFDTNVMSEPLKPVPNPAVINWLDAQEPQTLYLTTISLAELLAGIELLPTGRRRDGLEQALAPQIIALFAERIVSLDTPAAQALAKTQAAPRGQGNPIGFADCAIATIAHARVLHSDTKR